jgi:hypothetical protein
MRKIFIATLIIAASFSLSLAQGQQGNSTSGQSDIPNMGHAPTEINGIGRLDLRIVDENGNPVKGAFAKLESRRTDGFFCESWSPTDERGVAVLPPIHMGHLTLIIKAKGYQTIKMEVPLDSLSEPVHVTLHAK